MAIEKVIDIKIQGNADLAVASLRSQLRQAQADVAELSNKFGATSQEAINAAKRAGQLKDQIGDAKALTDAFNPDAKFRALSSSLGGVAGGFAAVQGGMALFGSQSEEVEKTLLKVQAAMALSMGLQSLGESIDSFKQLGAVVKSYSIVQKASTAAQWLWNAAQAASPIGAIIVAITALITAGVALVNYFKTSSEEAKNNSKAVNENAKALANETKALERGSKEFDKRQKHQVEMAKASGKSADAVRQLELKLADEKIAFEKSARAAAFNTYEKNKNYLATLKLADADEEVIKKQQETVNKSIESYNKQNQAVQASFDDKKAIQLRHQVEITQAERTHNEKLSEKQKENAQKAKELQDEKLKNEADALKKAQEEKVKQQEEWDKQARDKQIEDAYKAMDDVEAARKANADRLLSEQELAIQTENEAYKIKYDNAVKAGYDTEELEIEHLNRLNDINLTAQKKQYDDDKAISDAKIKLTQLEAQAREALLNKTKDTLAKGADLLGKNTASGKAMAAAAALINTYQGITAELATKTVTPFEIGLKIANVAIIAATGFKAVKDILSVKVPGGGGGGSAPSGGGVSGGGGATAPQFNVVGNTGTNQLAQSMAGQNAQLVQAYVVSGAVTTAQSLDRNIISNASIG